MSAHPGQVILGMNRSGFCIYINSVFEGPVPSVTESLPTDPAGAPGRACVFAMEREAQREIVENMMTRLQEFLDGEREKGGVMRSLLTARCR